MTTLQEQFNICVELFEALVSPNVSTDDIVEGEISDSLAFRPLEEKAKANGISLSIEGNKCRFCFVSNLNNSFCASFDSFLNSSRMCHVPDQFYIYNEKLLYSRDFNKSLIPGYLAIVTLYTILKEIADYSSVDEIENSILVFLNNSRLDIEILYSSSELKIISSDLIENFNHFINRDNINHRKEIISIIKSNLENRLFPLEKKQRFCSLISEFVCFFKNCKNDFEVYYKNFTFEKIRQEIDVHILDYVNRIDDVVGKSVTQCLAFVAAAWLSIYKLDNSGNAVFIFMSIIALAYIVKWHISNQKQTLKFLQDEINNYTDQIKQKLESSNIFKDKFDNLRAKAENAFRQNKSLAHLNEIILFLSTMVFINNNILVPLFKTDFKTFSLELLKYIFI